MVRNEKKNSKKNFLNFCSVDRPEMNPKWPEVKAVTMKEKWKKHQFTQVCVKIAFQFRWLENSDIEIVNSISIPLMFHHLKYKLFSQHPISKLPLKCDSNASRTQRIPSVSMNHQI